MNTDNVADIIRQFAYYLEIVIGYIKEFFSTFLKKEAADGETESETNA
ncbi:MAG: hypothetical protein IJS90_07940 [Clostridia bacterium]|nr:hypothetical protein [Clostridia bacterium]